MPLPGNLIRHHIFGCGTNAIELKAMVMNVGGEKAVHLGQSHPAANRMPEHSLPDLIACYLSE